MTCAEYDADAEEDILVAGEAERGFDPDADNVESDVERL